MSITTETELPQFTYDYIANRAKTVDVIWFNERQMPCRFYEIEHLKIFQTHWINSMSCRIFELIIILLPMKAVDDSFIRSWNSPCTLGL